MKLQPVIWRAPDGAEFEWDAAKAQANLRKHKVPFLIACESFKDDSRIERSGSSGEYDEDRWIVLGELDGRFFRWYLHSAENESA